eukprot:scaffold386_cov107-Skeletonema_dohrnii-CCMP3373.AAC.9
MEKQDLVTEHEAPDSVTTKITNSAYNEGGGSAGTWTMTERREVTFTNLDCVIVIAISIFVMYTFYQSQSKRRRKARSTTTTSIHAIVGMDFEMVGDENAQQVFSSDAIVDAEKARRSSSRRDSRRRSVDSANKPLQLQDV